MQRVGCGNEPFCIQLVQATTSEINFQWLHWTGLAWTLAEGGLCSVCVTTYPSVLSHTVQTIKTSPERLSSGVFSY